MVEENGILGALLFSVLEDSVVTLLSVVGQVGASQVVSFGIGRGVTRVLFKSGAIFTRVCCIRRHGAWTPLGWFIATKPVSLFISFVC